MSILMINGSPRKEGNTFLALLEVAKGLKEYGMESEIVQLGAKAIQGCIACNKCDELGQCAFNDSLYNEIRDKLQTSDGLVIGSPTYYAGPNGSLCALLDRVFYSCPEFLQYKPGAAVAVCRRGGASATLDRLNKYFTISNMPVVPSQYWNIIHGLMPGDVTKDDEGLQTMRTLGKNMAWMIKNLKENVVPQPMPEAERHFTCFIR